MVRKLRRFDITHELAMRPSRACDERSELRALERLETLWDQPPQVVFKAITEEAMSLCDAETCGISIKENADEGEVFRWVALVGVLQGHVYATTPRRFSPCGDTVDAGHPLLMRRPERFYEYLDVGVPIEEALLVPLNFAASTHEGTLWVIGHDHRSRFHADHARVMQRLGVYAASAALSYAAAVAPAQGWVASSPSADV